MNTVWTRDEQNLLKKYYYVLSETELAEKLPRFTRKQIVAQVYYLKKRGWKFYH